MGFVVPARWNWDRIFSGYVGFSLSVRFQRRYLLIHPSITNATNLSK
jgi:hypothetical protein